MKDDMTDSLKEGEQTATGFLSAAIRGTGNLIKTFIPRKYLLILGGFIALAVLATIVINTANSALGGSVPIMPTGVLIEKQPGFITDKQSSIDNVTQLTAVIRARQDEDYRKCIAELEALCRINDLDYDLSKSFLRTTSVISYESSPSQNTDKVIEEIKIQDATAFQKQGMYAVYEKDYPVHTDIKNVPNKFKVTARGLYIFDTGNTIDYVAAMPSYFGPEGGRFKITDKDGRTITVLKGSNIPDDSTEKRLGRYASSDAIFYFLGSEDMWPSYESSVAYALNIGEIAKIERIESQFSSVTVIQSGSELKVLSAFSVSIGNGELTRENVPVDPEYDPLTGRMIYHPEIYKTSVFYNSRGDEVKGLVFNDDGIDYKQTLEKKLKNYGGQFYSLDYDRNADGSLYKYEHKETIIEYEEVYDEARDRYYTVRKEVEVITYYCKPVIKERNFYSVAIDAFGLDLNDIYVNSCRWEKESDEKDAKMVPVGTNYITNLEAVNQMTKVTSSLLYNTTLGSGVIINSAFSGAFEWPVPASRYVTCPFGYRSGQYAGFHTAIDISCPIGTQVVSPEAGTVLYTGYDRAGGNYLYIQLDNGWACQYMHLSSFIAQVGQKVERGEVVALSGNTGEWTTGAHVHFMLWDPGIPYWTDPLPYVVRDESEIIKLY